MELVFSKVTDPAALRCSHRRRSSGSIDFELSGRLTFVLAARNGWVRSGEWSGDRLLDVERCLPALCNLRLF